ncbi:Periostin [Grifola frondosa]|uniref:Periostin n=1 Tax=Grifola frondosa TaxID=5627 RepID=A0A1C7MPQ3_GRIFR|nr:Periostin [Grifola frondosa]
MAALSSLLPTTPSVPIISSRNSLPQQHKTLLYPHWLTESPSQEPLPHPPWMPIPGGTLGGEPQRLRLSSRDAGMWIGVDASGEGGVEVVKEKVDADNGILLGIGDVLEVPTDLATVVSRYPSLRYLTKILTPDIEKFLNSTSELTLFLPVDKAWEALSPYERLYLESEFASDDLAWIMNMHAVVRKDVKWSESFEPGINLTTIEGPKLEIITSPEDHKVKVSSAELVDRDIYASNGVLHTVSSLLFPPGALQLTPEKYLLALNCSFFVSLLHSVNLTSLVNNTNVQQTILAPRDDVISVFGGGELPDKGSEELKRLLQYHFIPGRWTPKKLQNGMLLETALEEIGLDGGRQFGGAGIIGEHVEINNTLIYFVSRALVPPADALQTALPTLELSSFLAAIFSTNLADTLKTTPRTTLLMPPNSAFKRLGMLVSEHLLAPSSKPDLERVIRHHALVGVEYGASLQNGSQRTFGTLEGSDVHVDRRSEDGKVLMSASGGWAQMQTVLQPRNMLTQTGVIHEVSDIMIPRSVDLTVGKLVKAAKGSTMATMMTKAGLDWILNGTAPPEYSPWAEMGLSGSGWTLLCPTDDAFKKVNLTDLYANQERMREIVSQHLIPTADVLVSVSVDAQDVLNNNRPLSLNDGATYTTLHAADSVYGDVIFRVLDGEEGTVVGVKGARGHDGRHDWAHVVSWGRSTTGGGTGGVVQIDRLLIPYSPSWWVAYGAPAGVAAGGVVLICLFFLGVRAVWRRDTTEATYEPVGGFGHDDSDDS